MTQYVGSPYFQDLSCSPAAQLFRAAYWQDWSINSNMHVVVVICLKVIIRTEEICN